jgi:hypothetical protein
VRHQLGIAVIYMYKFVISRQIKGTVSLKKAGTGTRFKGCGSFGRPVLVQRVACITGVSIPETLRLVGSEIDLFNRCSGWMDSVSVRGKGGSARGDQYAARLLPQRHTDGTPPYVATSLRAGLQGFGEITNTGREF